MKSRTVVLLATLVVWFTSVPTRIHAATLTWTNNASGVWHEAGNWSPNQVPGPLDVAVFNRGVTVTVTNDVAVAELQFSGSGTINVTTGVLTAATLTWTGGWLRGIVQCGGGSISGNYGKYLVGGV
ncbi:MAG TPA: hypothetical protein PKO21_09870, partial [Verrucomicrobiota bacterium]|nr:hypothetical protein [Verrucomicrobiota bacterium]